MIRKALILTLLVGSTSAALPAPSSAQHLYNKERDDLAQEAQKLADELETGTVFDKQIKNLAVLSKQDISIHFLGARRRTRATIESFTTWQDVGAAVERVAAGVAAPATISAKDAGSARAELQGKIDAARAALEALKKAAIPSDDPLLSGALDRLGDLKSFQEYFNKIAQLSGGSLGASQQAESNQLGKALDALKSLYDRYAARLEAIRKLSADLEALKVPLQTVALQVLLVEEEHWKNVGAINARRQAEQAEVVELISDFWIRADRLKLKDPADPCKPKGPADPCKLKAEPITDTVNALGQAGNREGIADVFLALYVATALVTRGELPAELAELRLAQEEHRYSIRKSAVLARAYEVTIGTGTKRLALYHKGGIKPELVAQLVQAIATLGIPPAILMR